MAGPPVNPRTAVPSKNSSTANMNKMPDTSLVVDGQPERQRDAGFSRLQAVLGLRKKVTEDGKKLNSTALVLSD
jgi:hypothetical protein